MPQTTPIEMAAIKATIKALVETATRDDETKTFVITNVVMAEEAFNILKDWYYKNVFTQLSIKEKFRIKNVNKK